MNLSKYFEVCFIFYFTKTIFKNLTIQVEHKKREMTSACDVTEVMEIPKCNQLEAFKRCVTSSSGGVGRNHRGFGFVDFQNISKVEKGGFLFDDSIIIKIKAEIPS